MKKYIITFFLFISTQIFSTEEFIIHQKMTVHHFELKNIIDKLKSCNHINIKVERIEDNDFFIQWDEVIIIDI